MFHFHIIPPVRFPGLFLFRNNPRWIAPMLQIHTPHSMSRGHLRPTRGLSLKPTLSGLALVMAATSALPAADWIFERSYYSHSDSPAYTIGLVPQSRSAYRQPYVNLAPHSHVTGGWRWNNYQIQNGNTLDSTYMREFFIDSR